MKNFLPVQYKKTTKLKINHSYLVEQFADYSKIFKEIEKVVKRGDYTLGQKVNEFEQNFAKRVGAKFVIAVGNGTDALYLSLKAFNIGKGDEVITVPYTFISTVGAIVIAGAKPVFVDIKEDYNIDEKKINNAKNRFKITSDKLHIVLGVGGSGPTKRVDAEKFIKFMDLINEAKENNTILITTEKDYFRIDENYKKNINYLKIAVDIKNRNQLIEEIKKII